MPSYSVNEIIQDLLNDRWDTNNVAKPDIVISKKQDGRRVTVNDPTILLTNTELERERQTQDGQYRTEALVRIEIENTKETVSPELKEVIRIIEDNDGSGINNYDIGKYDVLEYDSIEPRDLDFGSYDAMVNVRLVSYIDK